MVPPVYRILLVIYNPRIFLKARSDFSNSAVTSKNCSALQLIGNCSIFTAIHCVSHWLQQNRCSLTKP